MKEETRWWLQTAERDFQDANVLCEAGSYNNAAFHLQQAAEQSMKALLIEMGEHERTHSSLQIMVELQRRKMKFPDDFDSNLRKLDRCFIDSRYPNGVGGPPEMLYNRKIVKELTECCKHVMAFVKSKLS
jgi:HEPN domain-containing protein